MSSVDEKIIFTHGRATLKTGAAASCTEGLSPFMALFVSSPARRVAGETDSVCSAQAARDDRAGMTHLRDDCLVVNLSSTISTIYPYPLLCCHNHISLALLVIYVVAILGSCPTFVTLPYIRVNRLY